MADPRAARLAKGATRSPHRFHGVTPPELRRVTRRLARRHQKDRDVSPVLAVARLLWRSPWHEEKSVAIGVVAIFSRRLGPEAWAEFKGWVRQCRSADHCDAISTGILGGLVKRDRSWCRVLKHWTFSRNPWERRAALGAVLPRTRHMGDAEAALALCEPLMRERRPEVQEAVAALLREAQGVDAALTQGFLDRWRGKAHPLILSASS